MNLLNTSFTQTIKVDKTQTADNYGSGALPVFATPALVALMENTAMKMVARDLPEGKSTVGTAINIRHLKASAVGETIECTATIKEIEGRKYVFEIQATDEQNDIIGEGIHERYIVDIEKFMSKMANK